MMENQDKEQLENQEEKLPREPKNNELVESALNQLEERRNKILSGSLNCVPSPFKKFTADFPGLEQSQYICVTSFTKGGKTQIVSYMFIFELVWFAYFTKADIDFHIIYFALEETKERIMQRFMSWLLFRVSKKSIRINPTNLRSTSSAVDESILDRLREFNMLGILNYFAEHIEFPAEENPTGIYKYCKQYAEDHGTVKKKTIKIKDELGELQEVEVFDSYEQDNPNEYRIVIIDTINLVSEERGWKKKECMDKMSEYCAKDLRNKYHFTPIVIQQQSFESEGNDAFKLGRVRPSVYGLGDSKYISRDADLVLGLFAPARFGITEYFGYDITILKDHIRFLEVIVNRNGQMGGLLPLWFDGDVCDFKELPKSSAYADATPTDKANLDKVYALCKTLDATGKYPSSSSPSKATSLLLSTKNAVKHFINYKI